MTKRYSAPVLCSCTVKLTRVSSAIGRNTLSRPSSRMRASSQWPAEPPVGHSAVHCPPMRVSTRATLMPPPPASCRVSPQRSLCVGTTRSVSVARSTAGFMVRQSTRKGWVGLFMPPF